MPTPRYYIDWRETELRLDLTQAMDPAPGSESGLRTGGGPHSRLVVLEAERMLTRVPDPHRVIQACSILSWHEFLAVVPPTEPWIEALTPAAKILRNVTVAFKARTQEDVDRARLAAVTLSQVALVLEPTEPIAFPPDAFLGVYLRSSPSTLNFDFHRFTDSLVAELAIARVPYYVEHSVTPSFTKFDDGGFYSIFSRKVSQ